MIKSRRMTAILLLLVMTFTATTGYAYGTTQDNSTQRHSRVRPSIAGEERASGDKQKKSAALHQLQDLKNYKDGEYTGTAEGYGGPLTVKVVIKNGKIKDLSVVSHNETPGYYENGLKVIEKVLSAGNLNVDTISGATVTSQAILEAAADALSKASNNKNEKPSVKSKTSKPAPSRANKAPTAAPVRTHGTNLSGKTLNDGVYRGSAQGFASMLSVEVTVRDGKIIDVRYVDGNDDEPYISNALALLPLIVENQGTHGVDAVSGATYSSNGLLNAANVAIAKAISPSGNLIPVVPEKPTSTKMPVPHNGDKGNNEKIDEGTGKLKDGTWSGSAQGYKSEIKISLTIKDEKIIDAKLDGHGDDKPYMDQAKVLLSRLVEKQSADLDAVTGATYSSNGIINAAKKALKAARGEKEAAPSSEATEKIKALEAQLKRQEDEIARLKAQEEDVEDDDDSEKMKDGLYKGKARGYNGPLEVMIEVENGVIISAQLGAHTDDAGYIDNAASILNEIVNNNGVKGIDVVSGATYSSKGILKAARKAIEKAKDGNESEEEDENEVAPIQPAPPASELLTNELQFMKTYLKEIMYGPAYSKEDGNIDEKEIQLKDGEYVGFGRGWFADIDGANMSEKDKHTSRQGGPYNRIKATVVIKDGVIDKIICDENQDDTRVFLADAIDGISSQLNGKNKKSTDGVDVVSGATYSSRGIIEAIDMALLKARIAYEYSSKNQSTEEIEKLKEENERLKKRIEELEGLKNENSNENDHKEGDGEGSENTPNDGTSS